MNTLTHVLITALLVVGGVAVYHVAFAERPASSDPPLMALADRDLGSLNQRVAALEERRPILVGNSQPADLLSRLKALEDEVAALERKRADAASVVAKTPDSTTPAGAPGGTASPGDAGADAAGDGTADDATIAPDFTPAQRTQIRSLVDAQIQTRDERRTDAALRRRLDQLGIHVTPEQEKKLSDALAAHRTALRDEMRQARDDGLSRDQVRDRLQALNQKLTDTVSTFLPASDAEAITSSMARGFGGGFGGGGGRRGGSRPSR